MSEYVLDSSRVPFGSPVAVFAAMYLPLIDHSSFLLSIAGGSSVSDTLGTRQIHQVEGGNTDCSIILGIQTSSWVLAAFLLATLNRNAENGVTARRAFVHGRARKGPRLFTEKENLQQTAKVRDNLFFGLHKDTAPRIFPYLQGAIVIEQIPHFFVVDFEKAGANQKDAIGLLRDMLKDVVGRHVHNAAATTAVESFRNRPRTLHRVRLSRRRLSVRENGSVETCANRLHNVLSHFLVDLRSAALFTKGLVVGEEVASHDAIRQRLALGRRLRHGRVLGKDFPHAAVIALIAVERAHTDGD